MLTHAGYWAWVNSSWGYLEKVGVRLSKNH